MLFTNSSVDVSWQQLPKSGSTDIKAWSLPVLFPNSSNEVG